MMDLYRSSGKVRLSARRRASRDSLVEAGPALRFVSLKLFAPGNGVVGDVGNPPARPAGRAASSNS